MAYGNGSRKTVKKKKKPSVQMAKKNTARKPSRGGY